jgi:nicotinamide-nucleotide amidase
MRAEILTTGTELLLGQIDDTNATYLARQLRDLGIDIYFRTTVGDNQARIVHALGVALERADVVITTGGLGPTVDDVTREAVAQVTGRPLVLYPDLLAQIEAFFAGLGAKMSDNNRRQAYLPEESIPIENPVGTAPAFIVETDRGTVITLPGVPREMRYLMEQVVVPYLQRRLGRHDLLVARILRTVAIGESRIDEAIADLQTSSNPTVGLSAHAGQTDVRIVAKASSEGEVAALLDACEARVRARLGDAIYATGDASLEAVVAALLRDRGMSVAVIETTTCGDVSRRLTCHDDVFAGGLVAPDAAGPGRLLGVDVARRPGKPGAVALAGAARDAWGTSTGLAVVEDDEERPWVAIAGMGADDVRRFRFRGRDARGRVWTTNLALEFLRRLLLDAAAGWAE